MNKLKQTGVRISQYPYAPVNRATYNNRLELDHSFITWAPAYFGTSTVNKNFQINLSTLREDMLGYIGVVNSKPSYRNYINLWQGDWNNPDRTKSYVYTWDQIQSTHQDYIKNKHGIDSEYDDQIRTNRVFLLTDAPIPLESTYTPVNASDTPNYGIDPNPKNFKIVSKKYIDDRHNGVRRIEKGEKPLVNGSVNGSELKIRPYTCFYEYFNLPAKDSDGVYTINITSTEELEDGRKMVDVLKHNRLRFYIRLKNRPQYYYKLENGVKKHFNNLKILVDGSTTNLSWSYENEFTEILREYRIKADDKNNQLNTQKGYIFIRCEAEYELNSSNKYEFKVTCSNFFGRGKNTKRVVETYFDKSKGLNEIDIQLALHENESFLTQIPQDEVNVNSIGQYYINLDASGLDDYHEYTWQYYVITPAYKDKVIVQGSDVETQKEKILSFDDVIFQGKGTSIMWAMEDGHNVAPRLEPNKIYCFQFVKVFDGILIGRIKYFVNLVKKS